MSQKLDITLGALEPPLARQLAGVLPKATLLMLDNFSDAITLLHLHGLISDRQASDARARLIKRIQFEINKPETQ